MKYVEYQFNIIPVFPWKDILTAYLAELPFESFLDVDNGILAYIKEDEDNEDSVKSLSLLNKSEVQINYIRKQCPDINWNSQWEKNFTAVSIEDQIYLRADFHPENKNIPYQIIMQPKMSFGTGHHETTYNMLHAMLGMDFSNKQVLDMGTGTGVLAIFAKIKGAAYVEAIDIDQWSFENAKENAERNSVYFEIKQGDASLLGEKKFDIILANINKNILLMDIKHYASNLNKFGLLLVSGIYEHDFDDIIKEASLYGLKFVQKWTKNNWISILMNYG